MVGWVLRHGHMFQSEETLQEAKLSVAVLTTVWLEFGGLQNSEFEEEDINLTHLSTTSTPFGTGFFFSWLFLFIVFVACFGFLPSPPYIHIRCQYSLDLGGFVCFVCLYLLFV